MSPSRSRPLPPIEMSKLSLPGELATLLWDAVPIGICLLAADQTVAFANRAAGRLLRLSSGACVGKTLPALIGQPFSLDDSLQAAGI